MPSLCDSAVIVKLWGCVLCQRRQSFLQQLVSQVSSGKHAASKMRHYEVTPSRCPDPTGVSVFCSAEQSAMKQIFDLGTMAGADAKARGAASAVIAAAR